MSDPIDSNNLGVRADVSVSKATPPVTFAASVIAEEIHAGPKDEFVLITGPSIAPARPWPLPTADNAYLAGLRRLSEQDRHDIFIKDQIAFRTSDKLSAHITDIHFKPYHLYHGGIARYDIERAAFMGIDLTPVVEATIRKINRSDDEIMEEINASPVAGKMTADEYRRILADNLWYIFVKEAAAIDRSLKKDLADRFWSTWTPNIERDSADVPFWPLKLGSLPYVAPAGELRVRVGQAVFAHERMRKDLEGGGRLTGLERNVYTIMGLLRDMDAQQENLVSGLRFLRALPANERADLVQHKIMGSVLKVFWPVGLNGGEDLLPTALKYRREIHTEAAMRDRSTLFLIEPLNETHSDDVTKSPTNERATHAALSGAVAIFGNAVPEIVNEPALVESTITLFNIVGVTDASSVTSVGFRIVGVAPEEVASQSLEEGVRQASGGEVPNNLAGLKVLGAQTLRPMIGHAPAMSFAFRMLR